MRLRVIACDVLFREFSLCAATSSTVVDASYLKKGLHEKPAELREALQREIDAVPEGEYDAIALLYGLCGKATEGLKARHTRLVIPKTHDCIALFLGSSAEYLRGFRQHPGTYYYTSGAWERGGSIGVDVSSSSAAKDAKLIEYVEKYGEDNAKYLLEMEDSWLTHYTRAAYIDFPGLDFPEYSERTRGVAAEKGLDYVELPGSYDLVRGLIEGPWGDGFLVVDPGCEVSATDDRAVMRARPSALAV